MKTLISIGVTTHLRREAINRRRSGLEWLLLLLDSLSLTHLTKEWQEAIIHQALKTLATMSRSLREGAVVVPVALQMRSTNPPSACLAISSLKSTRTPQTTPSSASARSLLLVATATMETTQGASRTAQISSRPLSALGLRPQQPDCILRL